MKNILYDILCMSLTGSLVFLLYKMTEMFTKRHFNASWHYNLLKCVALFFFVPFGHLHQLLNLGEVYQNNILAAVNPATGKGSVVIHAIFDNLKSYRNSQVSIAFYLVAIWITVTVILLFWQIICYIKFRNALSLYKHPAKVEIAQIGEQCARRLGIKKQVRIYVNEFIDTPMLIGFFSPIIILSTDHLDAPSARHVLTHELIHYKNRDLFIKFGMLFIRLLHWFNPIVYFTFKELDRWCEYTCDEKNVIDLSPDIRKQYGRVILDAISVMPTYGSRFGSPFILPKQRLKERLIFMFNVKKMRTGSKVVATSLAITLMTFGMVAALTSELANQALADTSSVSGYSVALPILEQSWTPVSQAEEKLEQYKDMIQP